MAENERVFADRQDLLPQADVSARDFLSQIEGFSLKPEVHITDLNLSDEGDLRLALMSVLRGKSEDDYFLIVTGLQEAYFKAEGNRAEQDRLHILSSRVMAIGEDVLRIDWS